MKLEQFSMFGFAPEFIAVGAKPFTAPPQPETFDHKAWHASVGGQYEEVIALERQQQSVRANDATTHPVI